MGVFNVTHQPFEHVLPLQEPYAFAPPDKGHELPTEQHTAVLRVGVVCCFLSAVGPSGVEYDRPEPLGFRTGMNNTAWEAKHTSLLDTARVSHVLENGLWSKNVAESLQQRNNTLIRLHCGN
jgi:hypothetical protein